MSHIFLRLVKLAMAASSRRATKALASSRWVGGGSGCLLGQLQGSCLGGRLRRSPLPAAAAVGVEGVLGRRQTTQRSSLQSPFVSMQLRSYIDSIDRTITVKSMEDPLEVLVFMAEHSDSDTRTHEAALRTLGRIIKGSNYQQVVSDGRFHIILSNLVSRLDDCDAKLLAMIADASKRFRDSTPELKEFAQRLGEAACRREDAFNPQGLSSIALALAARGVKDVNTVEFIRTETMKMIYDLEPSHCTALLEAFRRWGVFDKQLTDMIVERMLDEIDRFSSRDVVEAVGVASRLGLVRGFLLRRLCTLAFENLQQFQPRDLIRIVYALSKLRFLTPGMVDDIVDVLRPDVGRIGCKEISELLYTIAMVDARNQLELCRTLVAEYAQVEGVHKTLTSVADFSWALCSLELADEFQGELSEALRQIFAQKPPRNRVPLMKLFDVITALDTELKSLGIKVPQEWRAACEEADAFEMEKMEAARLHSEVMLRFDEMAKLGAGLKFQLKMERNRQCGPYRVDMFDEGSNLAVDLEVVSWPTSRRLKHRILQGLGYKTLRLDYWDWRRTRTEDDQNTFLQRQVSQALRA
eukprot:TRINITY_DN48658_c0_g1_i1.p1 TRINITY_DN48658_c0_g1~~TRINITY_DN48658_c0_g1_i1.p1  ORF type:complete len:582 (-),score=133.76 TRINITY_DN48658_c0_g1_i1:13-1758(-)